MPLKKMSIHGIALYSEQLYTVKIILQYVIHAAKANCVINTLRLVDKFNIILTATTEVFV